MARGFRMRVWAVKRCVKMREAIIFGELTLSFRTSAQVIVSHHV
jgi:hypothetical protein